MKLHFLETPVLRVIPIRLAATVLAAFCVLFAPGCGRERNVGGKIANATYHRAIERIVSLDPAEAASAYAGRAVALIYEPLLEYDYANRPYSLKPCLATGMPAVSPDGRIFTFEIDTNATFTADICFGTDSHGAPLSRHVSAEDFVFSLKRLADAKLASPGYWILDGKVKGIDEFREASRTNSTTDYTLEVAGLRTPAPDRLEVELISPSPVFLWQMAMPYASAVPHEAVEFYGDAFRDHAVGTGPYVLSEWRRNHSISFSKNPLWRGWRFSAADATFGSPFDTLIFPTIDDPSTQWLAFLSGGLDLQGEIARDNWDDVINEDGTLCKPLRDRGFTLECAPSLETGYIGINMRDPVLGSNKQLRQALNAAFDHTRWERFNLGRAIASNGPVPPNVEGADCSPLPFGSGRDVALCLLEKAGYPEGRDPTTGRRLRLVLDIGKTSQEIRESTELIVSFMAECGIEIVPEYHTWPAFLQKVREGRSQLFRIAWVGDYPDAENFLQLFYGPNAAPGPNRCNYSNPEYDNLFQAAMTAPHDERIRLYGEMQRILKDDCPWIFVSHAVSASLCGPRVANYHVHDFPYGMEKHLRTTNRGPQQGQDDDAARQSAK